MTTPREEIDWEHVRGVARVVLNFFDPPGNQVITLSGHDAQLLANAAISKADSILATERGGGETRAEALNALERLVVHTAMEDAQVALECEAIIKPFLAAAPKPPEEGRERILTSEQVHAFAMKHDHFAIPVRPGVTITWTDEETGEVIQRGTIKGRNVVPLAALQTGEREP